MTNKTYTNLGLAMRAGKLVSGDSAVLDAIRSGEAKLVILAEDAASNTQKKVRDKCGSYRVPLLEYGSREQLGSSIGREGRVVVAVTDAGFARLIAKSRETPAEVE